MSYQDECQFAIGAVRQACKLTRAVQKEMAESTLEKSDRSPVTVADFGAQAIIGKLLGIQYPEDALVGEEDATALRGNPEMLEKVSAYVSRQHSEAHGEAVCSWIDRGNSDGKVDRFWTLDPIDGTKGFLRGEQYAVAFALIVNGVVEVGIMGCPELEDGVNPVIGGAGSVLYAIRGEGAFVTGLDGDEARPLNVSDISDPAQARLLRSVESGHTNPGQIEELCESLGVTADPVRLDSQAKYGVLSGGGGDVYIRTITAKRPDYIEAIWDHAAGKLVVEEAGGRVTDLYGRPLDFSQGARLQNNRGILASNGHLHDAFLAALPALGYDPSSLA